jgi:DNA-binding MarR family transcriptional regulator
MKEGDARPRIGYAVAFLDRAIRRALSEALAPFGLTVAQYTVLWLLAHLEDMSNAQLARRAYITPQAMNEVLKHLEDRNLAERNPSPHHGRVQPARLTEAGRSALEACEAAVDTLEHDMFGELSADRQAELIDLLMHVGRRAARSPESS